jgi:hypothetical protein
MFVPQTASSSSNNNFFFSVFGDLKKHFTGFRILGNGAKWNFTSDWLQADEQILKPLVKATAAKYAADKKLAPRTPADCQS